MGIIRRKDIFMNKIVVWTGGIVVLLAMSACSTGNGNSGDGVKDRVGVKAPTEPVELVFYNPAAYGEEEFAEKYGNALSKMFPAYTFKFIPAAQHKLADLLVSGTRFDIIFNSIGNFEGAVLPNNLQ